MQVSCSSHPIVPVTGAPLQAALIKHTACNCYQQTAVHLPLTWSLCGPRALLLSSSSRHRPPVAAAVRRRLPRGDLRRHPLHLRHGAVPVPALRTPLPAIEDKKWKFGCNSAARNLVATWDTGVGSERHGLSNLQAAFPSQLLLDIPTLGQPNVAYRNTYYYRNRSGFFIGLIFW